MKENKNNMMDSALDPNIRQRYASDPTASVWVNASAGSGKTKVLTDRVLRLLLAGVEPRKILCLTFTKAAAAEMTLRVQEELSRWAVIPEDELIKKLYDLSGFMPSANEILKARLLFAQVIEANNALPIQTIHSFCGSILRTFPFEAGVSSHFEALDEPKMRVMKEKVYLKFLYEMMNDSSSMLHQSLMTLVKDYGIRDFLHLAYRIESSGYVSSLKSEDFQSFNDIYNRLLLQFNQPIGVKLCQLEQAFVENETFLDYIKSFVSLEFIPNEADKKKALIFEKWLNSDLLERKLMLQEYLDVFLTLKNESRKIVLTQKTQAMIGFNPEILVNEQARALRFKQSQVVLKNVDFSAHCLFLYREFANRFRLEKMNQEALDYDDLIDKAGFLLSRSDTLDWVSYKLDGGIDHILVDESQDTSPVQWQIIKALAEEFYTGESAKTKNRTLFVVGDEKQSIYSFQGARPEEFHNMHAFFREKVSAAHLKWNEVDLNISFRSSKTVLSFVDQLFLLPELKSGLGPSSMPLHHISYRNFEGRVELWPLLCDETEEETEGEDDNQEKLSLKSQSTPKILAQQIALHIQGLCQKKVFLKSKQRAIQPGDFMILFRKRGPLFFEVLKALKKRHIPVTGLDRIALHQSLIIQDLVKLLEWGILPEDDFKLAILLKSPLFNLSEEEILELAGLRNSNLWQSLSLKAEANLRFKGVYDYLGNILSKIDQMPVYDLLIEILGQGCPENAFSVRRAIKARFGTEADDILDEFLNLVAQNEQSFKSSSQSFVLWFQKLDYEMKRDSEHLSNKIRVMTVHGSKGLEAPFVILPDTTSSPRDREGVYLNETGSEEGAQLPLLLLSAEHSFDQVVTMKARKKALVSDEYKRLLYVAITRAAEHVLIAGIAPKREHAIKDTWYDWCACLMKEVGSPYSFEPSLKSNFVKTEGDLGESCSYYVLGTEYQYQENDPILTFKNSDKMGMNASQVLPEFYQRAYVQEGVCIQKDSLNPSAFADEASGFRERMSPKVIPDERSNLLSPELKGTIMHELLEILPRFGSEAWHKVANHYFSSLSTKVNIKDQDDLIDCVLKILSHSELAFLLSSKTRREVTVSGTIIWQGKEVYVKGRLDCLVEMDQDYLIVDYKTDALVPEDSTLIPQAYVIQLAFYQKLLEQQYPQKMIRTAILWTQTATLMHFNFEEKSA